MHLFHHSETPRKQGKRSDSEAEIQPGFAEHRESLYWTALMIAGNAEAARQSIIDAVPLKGLKENGLN